MKTKTPKLDALHLCALGIDEVKKRGTPEHAAALKLVNYGRKLWRERNMKSRETCPHCGKEAE